MIATICCVAVASTAHAQEIGGPKEAWNGFYVGGLGGLHSSHGQTVVTIVNRPMKQAPLNAATSILPPTSGAGGSDKVVGTGATGYLFKVGPWRIGAEREISFIEGSMNEPRLGAYGILGYASGAWVPYFKFGTESRHVEMPWTDTTTGTLRTSETNNLSKAFGLGVTYQADAKWFGRVELMQHIRSYHLETKLPAGWFVDVDSRSWQLRAGVGLTFN